MRLKSIATSVVLSRNVGDLHYGGFALLYFNLEHLIFGELCFIIITIAIARCHCTVFHVVLYFKSQLYDWLISNMFLLC